MFLNFQSTGGVEIRVGIKGVKLSSYVYLNIRKLIFDTSSHFNTVASLRIVPMTEPAILPPVSVPEQENYN